MKPYFTILVFKFFKTTYVWSFQNSLWLLILRLRLIYYLLQIKLWRVGVGHTCAYPRIKCLFPTLFFWNSLSLIDLELTALASLANRGLSFSTSSADIIGCSCTWCLCTWAGDLKGPQLLHEHPIRRGAFPSTDN